MKDGCMSKSRKPRVATDPTRLTYDYAGNRLSDGREAVVICDHVMITMKIGEKESTWRSDEVVELLVENPDGSTETMYTCRRGDIVLPRPNPIIAHNAHHDRTYAGGPQYSEETIRTVLRIVKQLREAGIKNHNEQAAVRLNTANVKSAHGRTWTPGMVHHITQAYGKQYHVRVRRTPNGDIAHDISLAPSEPTEPPTGSDRDEAILTTIIASIDTLEGELKLLRTWVAAYAKVTERVDVTPDELETLRGKAAKWDQFRALANER